MSLSSCLFAHQSQAAARAGTWRLEAGRALSLQPRHGGVLRLASGRLWATLDGPHAGPLNDQGDRVLEAGDALPVAGGQRLVIEGWRHAGEVRFSWDPLPEAVQLAAHEAQVSASWCELRQALGLGAGALARLLAGVAALALDRLAGHRAGARVLGAAR